MSNPQLDVLGIIFPAHPENIPLIRRLREEYEIDFPEDKKQKKKFIQQIPPEVREAVEAACREQVAKYPEIQQAIEASGPPQDGDSLRNEEGQEETASDRDLYENLAHYILTDECRPFPKTMTERLYKIEDEDGVWFKAEFGPFTDINAFTARIKKAFRETYRPPKIRAKSLLRNARYFRDKKLGKSYAEIAELELEPQLKQLGIEKYSPEYFALENKEKERIGRAKRRFKPQYKKLTDP